MSDMIKKICYKLLCNKFTGTVLIFLFKDKIPDLRWKGFVFTLRDIQIPSPLIASIFWGFYESAEIRFAEKYFKGNLNVLEMGGSCGIVTAHLVSKLQSGKKLISVEANSNLHAVWKENTRRTNRHKAELVLLNKAVHYESDVVDFHISANTTESSAVSHGNTDTTIVQIPAVTLGRIVDEFNLCDYIFVCDIEGAEAAVFFNEQAALACCQAILIELHMVTYKEINYTVELLREMIEKKGFTLKDYHGPVFYFERSSENNAA